MNSPEGKALFGPVQPNGQRNHVTGAFVKEALDRGAAVFNWEERKARAGQRQGSKVRGVGVTVGPHGAGSIGWDSIMTIRPDGKLYVQSGVGNLGTHSVIDLARVAAEVLDMPWEKVEVIWGDTGKHLPWTCPSVGSQTTHGMTRANMAGAEDARRKLQEIAALEMGGSPDDYEVGGERVYRPPQSRGRTELRGSGAPCHPAGRQVRRPRAARGHQPDDARVGHGARRPRADGRREGHLPARRRHLRLRHRLRRSRSRRRDGRRDARGLRRRRRRRHRDQSRAAWSRRSRAARASASRTRCSRSRWSIRSTACRSATGSTTASR